MAKLTQTLAENNERGARRELIEELFYDFQRSRVKVYRMNFTRGLFFGLGTVLGATVMVALSVWFLSQFVGFPVIGEYIKHLVNAIQRAK